METKFVSLFEASNPRRRIPSWRGELTTDKILRTLRNKVRESFHGPIAGWKFIQSYTDPQDLAAHTYWHGSGGGFSGGLSPSISQPRFDTNSAGGGYDQKYWGISVSKSKNVASKFTGNNRYGTVYMVLLHKDAKVKEMSHLSDAVELEDHIVSLWEEGVDAVLLNQEGDFSEKELVILNPHAVWVGNPEGFKVFDKKPFEQPTPDQLWNASRGFEQKASVEAARKKVEFARKKVEFARGNVSRWVNFQREHPNHNPDEIAKKISDARIKLADLTPHETERLPESRAVFVSLFEGWDETEASRKEARKNTATDPSEAQKKSGNYAKGKFWWNSMEIAIENPKGSVRSGVSETGRKWSTKMAADYGYIRRSISDSDKDHLDVFIGPTLSSSVVFIIDQNNPNTGKYDEHKCMIGFVNEKEAKDAYMGSYTSTWKGFRSITAVTIDDFRKWIASEDTSKPFSLNESIRGRRGPHLYGHFQNSQERS